MRIAGYRQKLIRNFNSQQELNFLLRERVAEYVLGFQTASLLYQARSEVVALAPRAPYTLLSQGAALVPYHMIFDGLFSLCYAGSIPRGGAHAEEVVHYQSD
jgi:hypothetical protein